MRGGHTHVERFIKILRESVPADRWPGVCSDIQALSDVLRADKNYVYWASRDAKRWDSLIYLSEHLELVRLLQFLKKKKSLGFIVDIADQLAEKRGHVIVEYAHQKPEQDQDIEELVDSIWQTKYTLSYVRNDNLIHGVRLVYGKQVFDTSFRHYRHNLMMQLRRTKVS